MTDEEYEKELYVIKQKWATAQRYSGPDWDIKAAAYRQRELDELIDLEKRRNENVHL